ncbi:hypothetical protein ACIBQ6_48480 [Nonomuraea sp. NPDC049655]|uniref:hypothetical protein n=1 Tax=Nonomuraea sp. NPDC049655 TaxID=3364355 RepID=UPI0037ABD733
MGVGGYLVVRAMTKPAHNDVTAVILQPTASQSTKDAISRRLVSMPQIDTVYYAGAVLGHGLFLSARVPTPPRQESS